MHELGYTQVNVQLRLSVWVPCTEGTGVVCVLAIGVRGVHCACVVSLKECLVRARVSCVCVHGVCARVLCVRGVRARVCAWWTHSQTQHCISSRTNTHSRTLHSAKKLYDACWRVLQKT